MLNQKKICINISCKKMLCMAMVQSKIDNIVTDYKLFLIQVKEPILFANIVHDLAAGHV